VKRVQMDQTISDTKIPIRIAFVKPDGTPGIISLIVSYLQNNPKCGFEIATDKPPYKGTRGTGHVKIIESQGQEILKILMKKYLGNKESTLSKYLNDNLEAEVALEITPQSIFNYDYSKRMKDV
jgi:hypothetical protein